jgi:hypothetical protein
VRVQGRGKKTKTPAPRPPRTNPPPFHPSLALTRPTSTYPPHTNPRQAVDYAINSAWKSNNKGKLYEDCVKAGTIGGATGGDDE